MAIPLPKPTKPGGLGEKAETVLVRFLTRTLDAGKDVLARVIGAGFKIVLDAIEYSIADKAGPLLAMLQSTGELPGWLSGYVTELQNPTDQGTAIGLGGMAMGAASQMSSALLAPYLRKINYAMDRTAQSARLSPGENFAARWRYPEYLGQLEDGLRDLGYTADLEPVLEALLRPRLSGAEGVRAAWLDNEDPGPVLAELKARGYLAKDIERLVTLLELRPGPGDLVRFGVREAWRDDVAAKWGYDSDFPAQFGAEMQRAGDTEGWAQRYWRAHWELPSVNMVTEMLHRGVVTDEEFSEYLRIADYPAGWRARIEQVTYTPYTRVDTRRMYRFGVLDEAGVYNTYRDIGYDHEHASAMTQFTVLDALTDERELTKADIVKSYRLARFTRAEAQANLEALGYNATLAGLLLSNEDQAEENSQISGVVSNTHSLYIRGGITKAEAMARFAGLNLATSEVDRYFELWDLEKESRIALPTRSALDGFLGDDIITVAQYEAGLGSLSYQPEAIAWYTQGVLLDKTTRAEKEKDRAIAEAGRVAKREEATEYQREKALLTVALREVEARIGELQTAVQSRALSYQADADLARQRYTVSNLTAEYERLRALSQTEADDLSIATRGLRAEIEELQTEIAKVRLQLEAATDEALKEEARLQISVLQGHKEEIQTIQAEGRAEIAAIEAEIVDLVDPTLTEEARLQIAGLQVDKEGIQTIQAEGRAEIAVIEAEIVDLVDPALTEETRLQISQLQTEIETVQDTVREYQEERAEIKRALLDAGPDEAEVLQVRFLDLAVLIAGRQVTIDEIQTQIAAIRETFIAPELALALHSRQEKAVVIRAGIAQAGVFLQEIDESIVEIRLAQIDPVLAGDLHVRRLLVAEIRANNAQAAVILQEIDEQVAEIRLSQIDPAQVEQVQILRTQIAGLGIEIEELQDMIAAFAVTIAEIQAGLRRLREGYQADLRELQRVRSLDEVEASYRADVAALQAELGQARGVKNRLRVQLAEIRFEYAG